MDAYRSDAQRWCDGLHRPAGDTPIFPVDTILTECMHCPAMIETRTGEQGIQDAIAAGWDIDGAGDLICAECTEARAEMLGDEG